MEITDDGRDKRTQEPGQRSVFLRVLGAALLVAGGWALVEGLYGFYYNRINIDMAVRQGLPYSTGEKVSMLAASWLMLAIAAGIILGGAKLLARWRGVLGVAVCACALAYLLPSNPYVCTSGLIGCQIGCRIFGAMYLAAGVALVVWDWRIRSHPRVSKPLVQQQ